MPLADCTSLPGPWLKIPQESQLHWPVTSATDPSANEASVGIVLTRAAQRYEVVCDWQRDIQVTTSRLDRYAPDCLYDQDTGTLFTTNGFSYGPWVVDPLNMERYNAVHVYLPECRTYVTMLLSDLPGEWRYTHQKATTEKVCKYL